MDWNDSGVWRIIAGFSGGLLNLLYIRKSDGWSVAGSVLGGTITGYFLGPAAAHFAPTWLGDGGASLLVGFLAMPLCKIISVGITAMVRAKIGLPPEDRR